MNLSELKQAIDIAQSAYSLAQLVLLRFVAEHDSTYCDSLIRDLEAEKRRGVLELNLYKVTRKNLVKMRKILRRGELKEI